jgi:DNA repair protein RadA
MDSKSHEQHTAYPTNNSFFRSAAEFSQRHRKERLSTGSKHLDDLLSGGLELGEITQFYGAPTAGKTHLCHFLCVVLPSQYQVIYIDTEGTFREEKIQSIAKARKLDPVKYFRTSKYYNQKIVNSKNHALKMLALMSNLIQKLNY